MYGSCIMKLDLFCKQISVGLIYSSGDSSPLSLFSLNHCFIALLCIYSYVTFIISLVSVKRPPVKAADICCVGGQYKVRAVLLMNSSGLCETNFKHLLSKMFEKIKGKLTVDVSPIPNYGFKSGVKLNRSFNTPVTPGHVSYEHGSF